MRNEDFYKYDITYVNGTTEKISYYAKQRILDHDMSEGPLAKISGDGEYGSAWYVNVNHVMKIGYNDEDTVRVARAIIQSRIGDKPHNCKDYSVWEGKVKALGDGFEFYFEGDDEDPLWKCDCDNCTKG